MSTMTLGTRKRQTKTAKPLMAVAAIAATRTDMVGGIIERPETEDGRKTLNDRRRRKSVLCSDFYLYDL
jgi:hypothetical protein